MLRQTVQYGWTTAMQQGTVQLGKIAIQAVVNTMGGERHGRLCRPPAGWTTLPTPPQQNIGHAMTTLMAQNRGAAKPDRVRRGLCGRGCGSRRCTAWPSWRCAFFGAEAHHAGCLPTSRKVIALGVRFLRLVSLFYLLPSATNGIQGGFRGVGQLQVTLNSSLLNMGGRVAAAALFVLVFHMDIEALPWSYAVGWACMLLYELPAAVPPLERGLLLTHAKIAKIPRFPARENGGSFCGVYSGDHWARSAACLASRASILRMGSAMAETDTSWFSASTK